MYDVSGDGMWRESHGSGVIRLIILLKQAFLRYLTEYYGTNLAPSTILTRRNNFSKCFIASFRGLLLKEKNLLQQEQILFL